MKARRAEPKQEFIPVILTLESQKEVDSLFTMGNHMTICRVFPVLNKLYASLLPFASAREHRERLFEKLNLVMYH